MQTNNTPPTEPDTQQPADEGLDDATCSARVAEMEALEKAIQHGEYEIRRAQEQLAAMQRKQLARQHELGYQKARMGLRPGSRVSDNAKPGYRMVIVQTDAGIATRYIPEQNSQLSQPQNPYNQP